MVKSFANQLKNNHCLFFFIIAGTKFDLQNSGEGTCATTFNNNFVAIGGLGNSGYHGKVDRCSNHNHHHPLSIRGTTLRAITWVLFPTWPHLE